MNNIMRVHIITFTLNYKKNNKRGAIQLYDAYWHKKCPWSGREDSNLRPPAPEAGALPGCATPRKPGNGV